MPEPLLTPQPFPGASQTSYPNQRVRCPLCGGSAYENSETKWLFCMDCAYDGPIQDAKDQARREQLYEYEQM